MNQELKDLVHRHKEIAQETKEKNGRLVFGTLCSYVPVEILHAFDILPVRLWGEDTNNERANELLPTFNAPARILWLWVWPATMIFWMD